MRAILAFLVVPGLLLCGPAANAEKADREKEINVGADRLTADDVARTSLFEGNVVVTQGTMRITAEKVAVREDADRNKFYVATGAPVTFRQKRDRIEDWIEGYAQRAEFDDKNDVLRLFTRARVKSNQGEITGDFISYDMASDRVEVTCAPPGAAAPTSGSRVKAILMPPKKDAKDATAREAAPAAPAPPMKLKPDAGPQG